MYAVNGTIVCINGGMVLPSEYNEKEKFISGNAAGTDISRIIAAVFSSENI